MKRAAKSKNLISHGADQSISERLKWVSKTFFKNQSGAAIAAGAPKSSFCRWLAGHDPSFIAMARLSDVSGVSLDWIATGKGKLLRKETPAVREHLDRLIAEHSRTGEMIQALGGLDEV